MTACRVCNVEMEEVYSNFRHPCTQEIFPICQACHDNDENWISDDFNDSWLVIMDVPIITYYDGEDERRRVNPKRYFDCGRENSATFRCDHCDEDFYGASRLIEDTGDYYCRHCAEHSAFWSEDDESYYSSEDAAPLEDEDENEASPQITPPTRTGWYIFSGAPTSRFLASPPVGIEFEHAPVRSTSVDLGNDLYGYIVRNDPDSDRGHWESRFVCHSDGSIEQFDGYSAAEIVSMPSSGEELDAIIRRFYQPFADKVFEPGPEHYKAGFHMHVQSAYLALIKLGLRDSDRFARRSSVEMLGSMDKICREFVSTSRRNHTYCSGSPGVRNKGIGLSGSSDMIDLFGRVDYPTIAVRTIGTIEYRLWPSSNSLRNTLARAELSQKLTLFWDKCLTGGEGGVSVYSFDDHSKSQVKRLKNIADMCVGVERAGIPSALQDLLELSNETTSDLKRLSARFNPFSGKATAFKFTDAQVRHIKSEHTDKSAAFIRADGKELQRVGDSTAMCGGEGQDAVYLTFGDCEKCYGAKDKTKLADAIAAMAKGEN